MENKYAGLSPYNYSMNNPVMMNDPSGAAPENNLSAENSKFINDTKSFLSDEVQRVENKIADIEKRIDDRYQKGKDFLEKKFSAEYDKVAQSLKTPKSKEEFISDKINSWFFDEYKASGKFEQQKQLSELKELSDFFNNTTFSNESLTLGSVIRNEAGSSSQIAKEAVGHGWLNRTNDIVREPQGAEISHYKPLSDRMNSYSNSSEKINFLRDLKNSVNAADTVLKIENRSEHDPTEGSKHWISPMANLFNAKNGGNTQERTINGKTRFVPEWARGNSDSTGIAKMQKDGRLMNNYKEVNIFNKNKTINYDFTFYRGVR